MRQAHSFLRLKPVDRVLLLYAAALLAIVRVCIVVMPFRSLRRLVAWAAQPARARQATLRVSASQIAWAVDVASCYVPRAGTCLPRALAAQVLLGRFGFPARVRIGVARAANGLVEGHAWVECDGKIVIGDFQVERYTPLIGFEGTGI